MSRQRRSVPKVPRTSPRGSRSQAADPEAEGALDGGRLEGAGPPYLFQSDDVALAERYLGPGWVGLLCGRYPELRLGVEAAAPDEFSQGRAHILEGAAALLLPDAVHDQSDVARHPPPPCEMFLRPGNAGSVHGGQR